jgi:hypothetical protein
VVKDIKTLNFEESGITALIGLKTKAEVTVAQKRNQEQRKERAVIVPFLNFLWLLSLFQDKESNNPHLQQL